MNVKQLAAMWQQKKSPVQNHTTLKPSNISTKLVTHNTFIYQPVKKQNIESFVKQTNSAQQVQNVRSKDKKNEHQTNIKVQQVSNENQKIDVKSLKNKFELLHIPMGASKMPSVHSNSQIQQIKPVNEINQIHQGHESLSKLNDHKEQYIQMQNQKHQVLENSKQMTFQQKRQLAQRLYTIPKLHIRLSNDSDNLKVRSPFAQIEENQHQINSITLTHQILHVQQNSQRKIQSSKNFTEQISNVGSKNQNQAKAERMTLEVRNLRNKKAIRETDFDDL